MEATISNIIAGLALFLSGYATWRSHKFNKKEEDLLDLQRLVNALVLDKEQREAAQANRAELSANFVTLGGNKHRLKIFNKGKAVAHRVQIDFPDGNDLVMESDIREKFPMESMEPGQTVELIAAVMLGSKRKLTVHLSWQDVGGEEREKMIHATL